MSLPPADQFREAATARGLMLPESLEADGRIHRCRVVGHNDLDGAYLLFLDGVPAGGFQNHTDGEGWQNWRANSSRALTASEEAAWTSRVEAARKAREDEQRETQAQAKEKAQQHWKAAKPCTSHPYLERKGVKAHETRIRGNDLLIPLYSSSGTVWNVQTISPAGSKLFLKDGRKQGCFFLIGKHRGTDPLYVCEGFATGATVHEATGGAVAVAFDCGNLQPAGKALLKLFPTAEMVWCADDDWKTPNNPGRSRAEAAAKALGGRVVWPDFSAIQRNSETDFNDLAQVTSLDEVRRQVEGRDALPRRLQRLTWRDFKDAPPPELRWLWEGVIPAGVPGIFASKPGHGKTWLALQLAVAVATGLPFLGLPTSGPGGVVFLEMEQSRGTLHSRQRAIVAGLGEVWNPGLDEALDQNMVLLPPLPPSDPGNAAALDYRMRGLLWEIEDAIAALPVPLHLLVVDTLTSVSEGDENSVEGVRPLWAIAHALAAKHGATVMFLHHTRKGGVGANTPTLEARMDPESLRGSNAQEGSARFVLQLGAITKAEAGKVGLDLERATRRFGILAATKNNDGPESAWMFLEHGPTGPWEVHPQGVDVLAALQGPAALQALAAKDALLLAMFQAWRAKHPLDRKAVALKLYGESKDPLRTLSAALTKLRKDGLVGKTDVLTPTGFQRAQLLAQPGATEDDEIQPGAA